MMLYPMHAEGAYYERPTVIGDLPASPQLLQVIPWVERRTPDSLKQKEGMAKVRLCLCLWARVACFCVRTCVLVPLYVWVHSAGPQAERRNGGGLRLVHVQRCGWLRCSSIGPFCLCPWHLCAQLSFWPDARSQMKKVYFLTVESTTPYRVALDQVGSQSHQYLHCVTYTVLVTIRRLCN